ncbi:MAG: hypothetical protein GY844_30885 [Bradyrhizobium sp.]|nr:hypothetical protein [Bradyrhizobium sp.]
MKFRSSDGEGRRTEIDFLNGLVVRKGGKVGIARACFLESSASRPVPLRRVLAQRQLASI